MIEKECTGCGITLKRWPSACKRSNIYFCNRSCQMTYRNKVNNPSWYRDLKGKNNPMYGKHPVAWNKGIMGDECHNWKGGIHKRKDGYFRINVNGDRKLLHRYLLEGKLAPGEIVHHKDENPSNNNLENLIIMRSQAEHARYHAITRRTK